MGGGQVPFLRRAGVHRSGVARTWAGACVGLGGRRLAPRPALRAPRRAGWKKLALVPSGFRQSHIFEPPRGRWAWGSCRVFLKETWDFFISLSLFALPTQVACLLRPVSGELRTGMKIGKQNKTNQHRPSAGAWGGGWGAGSQWAQRTAPFFLFSSLPLLPSALRPGRKCPAAKCVLKPPPGPGGCPHPTEH